jgi:hypothetical protein
MLEYYLPPAAAVRRGHAVMEDMEAIGFPLVTNREVSAAEWRARGVRPQAEYDLPVTPFSLDAADGHQAMAGSSLTRGNLLRLSHAVELGRRWLPGLWPGAFADDLCGAKHLDTITEVWWLKHWRGLADVQRGPKEDPASPDFDWLLTIRTGLADCVINLEVKRRTANLNAWFKHGNPGVPLRDIEKKFQPSADNAANIAALTVFQPPTTESRRQTADWLTASKTVDGIVVWIENNHGTNPLLTLVKPRKKWVEFLINPTDSEDLMVAGLTHGTLCLPHEVPAFLDRMAATVTTRPAQ